MKRFILATLCCLITLAVSPLVASAVILQNQTTATADDGTGSYFVATPATLVVSGWTSSCGGFRATYSLKNQTDTCLSNCANNFFIGVTSCPGAGETGHGGRRSLGRERGGGQQQGE